MHPLLQVQSVLLRSVAPCIATSQVFHLGLGMHVRIQTRGALKALKAALLGQVVVLMAVLKTVLLEHVTRLNDY